MSYHYSDIDDLPPMRVPDVTSERNALYVILCDFISPDEIQKRIKDVYAGKYNQRNTNEKARI
jgi:hypothetical protein